MEGACYEMMVNIEHLKGFGIVFDKIYATGGGARSEVWLQIKSDIWNKSVISLAAKEVGACGTCMLCGVAIGLYRDLHEAKQVFVKEKSTHTPNERNVTLYQKKFGAYAKLYRALRPIIEEMKQ